jgi:hypothetical protein
MGNTNLDQYQFHEVWTANGFVAGGGAGAGRFLLDISRRKTEVSPPFFLNLSLSPMTERGTTTSFSWKEKIDWESCRRTLVSRMKVFRAKGQVLSVRGLERNYQANVKKVL